MMSTTKRKPVKNKRDIFEASDQPHGTADYRKNMVGQWITYQQNEPASLHEPTVLESNAPSATQKSRPPPPSKSQQYNGMYSSANEQQRMKKRKHDQKDVPKFADFDAQPPFGIDNMDEPFFEFDLNNQRRTSKSSNNNNRTHYDSNRILHDPVQSKIQNRKPKYDNGMGRDEYGTLNVHHHRHHHKSQGHPIDVRPPNKRQKPSNQHFEMDDIEEFDDFQFNFDAGQTEQRQQLVRKEDKRIEGKHANRKNIDKSHRRDPFIDFDLLADAFDADDKNNRQPPQQFTYKHFKKQSYAELMGTTPTWQKVDNDLHKSAAAIDDGLLFKHPAGIMGAEQNAVQILDPLDERGSHRRRDHLEKHVKEKFIPKPSNDSKLFAVLETDHIGTATATSTQPNTFYIKCNNLIIKHDWMHHFLQN